MSNCRYCGRPAGVGEGLCHGGYLCAEAVKAKLDARTEQVASLTRERDQLQARNDVQAYGLMELSALRDAAIKRLNAACDAHDIQIRRVGDLEQELRAAIKRATDAEDRLSKISEVLKTLKEGSWPGTVADRSGGLLERAKVCALQLHEMEGELRQ